MSHSQTNFPDFQALRRRLIFSLGINALLPLLLYALLRPLLASDAAALAIAAAIPALRTLALWFFRRRVDWIGAHAVLGFGLALALTVLLAGDVFLLKVHGPLLIGILGLVLLVSVVIRKPLLEPVLRALGAPERKIRASSKMPRMTRLVGCALPGASRLSPPWSAWTWLFVIRSRCIP